VAQGSARTEPIDAERLFHCASRYRQSLRDADLRGADLDGLRAEGIDMRGASFAGASLFDAGFVETDLTGATFTGADLKESYFKRSDLRNADFRDADLTKAAFTYGDIAGADFTGARLAGASFANVSNTERAVGLSLRATDAVRPDVLTPVPGLMSTPQGFPEATSTSDDSSIARQLIARVAGKRVSLLSPATAGQPPVEVSAFVCSNGELLLKDKRVSTGGGGGAPALRTGRWQISERGGQGLIRVWLNDGEQRVHQAAIRGGVIWIDGTQARVNDDNILCE
jgi:hypothetical protein